MYHITLNLNAKLRPLDRGDLYEDPIDKALNEASLGEVGGGGTLMAENGEVESCDIEIYLTEYTPTNRQALLEIINKIGVPKGSFLIDDTNQQAIGTLEGLALTMNGTDLPNSVYEKCDINIVVEECTKAMEGIGGFYSYYAGPQNTLLYFYGSSFTEMKKRITPFVNSYPLCQKSQITQIA